MMGAVAGMKDRGWARFDGKLGSVGRRDVSEPRPIDIAALSMASRSVTGRIAKVHRAVASRSASRLRSSMVARYRQKT
jgi:hypothetical protein